MATRGGRGRQYRLGDFLATAPVVPVPSEDGQALLLVVPLDGDRADEVLDGGESAVSVAADTLRRQLAQAPQGLEGHITGPGGVIADLVTAFAGVDGKLLGVALAAVFVILLLVYRSPLLPIAVLLTSLVGLSGAALLVFHLARAGAITVSGMTQGILFILVVGAATDYSLLLVARYREELHDERSTVAAMRRAWRGSLSSIVASATTVVLGLLCLSLSELGVDAQPGARGSDRNRRSAPGSADLPARRAAPRPLGVLAARAARRPRARGGRGGPTWPLGSGRRPGRTPSADRLGRDGPVPRRGSRVRPDVPVVRCQPDRHVPKRRWTRWWDSACWASTSPPGLARRPSSSLGRTT